MARSQTIITILEELGDEDFKSFKWHLSEDKRIPRQIPYAQLAKLDRVDTSAKIKQSYGTEGGLKFMILVLEVIDRNDLKERYSPKTRQESDIFVLPDITDEQWHSQEGAFPEETSGSQWKMYRCMGVGLFCAILGNILLLVSTATIDWQVYRWLGVPPKYTQGLWMECTDKDNTCIPIHEVMTKRVPAVTTAGAFMILSSMVCFAGIIMSFVQIFKRSLAAGILFLISAFIVLMIMAIYTGMAFSDFKGQNADNWYFGSSYKLGWVATVMILFAGMLQMWDYRKRRIGPR